MVELALSIFTKDEQFPFFINKGYNDDTYMHTHKDFSELVIVLSGTAAHHVCGESYIVRKGDVFVINSGTGHGYTQTKDFQICNIMYNPEHFVHIDSDIRKLAGFHALFVIEPYLARSGNFKSRLRLPPGDFEKINNTINKIIDEYENKQYGRMTMIRAYFMCMMVTLSRLYAIPEPARQHNMINLAGAVSYIENNYSENISVKDLSSLMYMSDRHFSRVFKQAYQLTVSEYIMNLRMQRAREMLENTPATLTEIAVENGFGDGSYFARQFKKRFGMTPRDYRKRHTLL